jgi:signal transduction histidine kinase
VSLRVSDDGCGFDPREPESADHYGLVSMRERAAQIGGRLVLTSRAGSGTSVAVSISSSGEAREVA